MCISTLHALHVLVIRKSKCNMQSPLVVHIQAVSLSTSTAPVAPDVQDLVTRCLLPDPAARPTFEQIWQDLQEQCKALRQGISVPNPTPKVMAS